MAHARMYRGYGSGYRITINTQMKYLISIIFIIIAIVVTYIVTPRPFIVHHHANFATYIDGKKWDFSSYVYMEEVSRCNVTQGVTPEDRIHLHNGK